MAHIKAGDRVRLHYRTRLEDGREVDNSKDDGPVEIVAGASDVLPGVAQGIIGMSVGERHLFELTPEQGYGPGRQGVERRVPRSALPRSAAPGDAVRLAVAGVEMVLWVVTEEGDEVVLSSQHPLSGRTLLVDVFICSAEPS